MEQDLTPGPHPFEALPPLLLFGTFLVSHKFTKEKIKIGKETKKVKPICLSLVYRRRRLENLFRYLSCVFRTDSGYTCSFMPYYLQGYAIRQQVSKFHLQVISKRIYRFHRYALSSTYRDMLSVSTAGIEISLASNIEKNLSISPILLLSSIVIYCLLGINTSYYRYQ